LKTISFFALLIYWSVIILAPVLSKEFKIYKEEGLITPVQKPNK